MIAIFNVLCICMVLSGFPGQGVFVTTSGNQEVDSRMAMARSQHELITLKIDKGEFDKVPAEFQKILDLRLNGKFERHVVDEVQILSELLGKKGHLEIALKVADMALAQLKEKESQIRLLKEKGFIFKKLGKDDKAMEIFQRVRELEKQ